MGPRWSEGAAFPQLGGGLVQDAELREWGGGEGKTGDTLTGTNPRALEVLRNGGGERFGGGGWRFGRWKGDAGDLVAAVDDGGGEAAAEEPGADPAGEEGDRRRLADVLRRAAQGLPRACRGKGTAKRRKGTGGQSGTDWVRMTVVAIPGDTCA